MALKRSLIIFHTLKTRSNVAAAGYRLEILLALSATVVLSSVVFYIIAVAFSKLLHIAVMPSKRIDLIKYPNHGLDLVGLLSNILTERED